jgi:hypothetical protein
LSTGEPGFGTVAQLVEPGFEELLDRDPVTVARS